ncbi:MAG TPA: SCO family protein [Rhodanobacteraceae bacterium]|nr:SCO family protein [Rhodanobacteraceae bacterium]
MNRLCSIFASLLLLAGAAQAANLPSDSIYQARIQLTDQNGQSGLLADRRGTVQLVSMFYTRCTMVCPMIIQTMQASRRAAGIEDPARLALLAVSFDPAMDNSQVLNDYAVSHRLDARYWSLAHASAPDTRTLAALLGVQYKALSGGGFNHTSVLLLLDAEGRVLARSETLGTPEPAFVEAIRRATGG